MLRLLVLLLVLVFLGLQYRLWIADGGYAEIHRLDNKIAAYKKKNAGLKARNDALKAEIQDLKNGGEATEERARTGLGFVMPGEDFYLIVPPAKPPPASDKPSSSGQYGAQGATTGKAATAH